MAKLKCSDLVLFDILKYFVVLDFCLSQMFHQSFMRSSFSTAHQELSIGLSMMHVCIDEKCIIHILKVSVEPGLATVFMLVNSLRGESLGNGFLWYPAQAKLVSELSANGYFANIAVLYLLL